jgi:hypothetical protein
MHLCLYKESELVSFDNKTLGVGYTSTTMPLLIRFEEVFGVDSQFNLLCEKHVLSIICQHQIVTLAFYSQEMQKCWSTFVSNHAGQSELKAHNNVELW